jgi:hypothetical protein
VVAYTDSDFAAILALSGAAIPSVLLRGVGDTVDEQVDCRATGPPPVVAARGVLRQWTGSAIDDGLGNGAHTYRQPIGEPDGSQRL